MDYKSELLKQGRKIFKTDDLALLWQIKKRNTLLKTIYRYLEREVLFSVRKGVYSVMPPEELDPFVLGTAYMKGFCYVSLQTVLAKEGLINQVVRRVTLIGERSLEFEAGGREYSCRKMKKEYLYNQMGIEFKHEYAQASKARAIADILYYNSDFYFDKKWGEVENRVEEIRKQVFLK